jgi:hypothetical protein
MNFGELPTTKRAEEGRDKRTEIFQQFIKMAKGIDCLDGKSVEEAFDPKDENVRRELLARLSAEEYCQLITGVNGILRGKKKADWCMDGVGVTSAGTEVVGAHIFPNYKDKQEILKKSWDGAQQMNVAGRDLEEIGMLLGSMLVEIHPFNDGNGRTSRFVYSMVKKGYSQEEVREILGEEGREKYDMALSKIYIDKLFHTRRGKMNEKLNSSSIGCVFAGEGIPFGKLSFPEGTSDETKENIIQAGRNDNDILVSGVLHFLQAHPEVNAENYIKDFPRQRVFLLQDFLAASTRERAEELEVTYWGMKKQYTEDMIDIFINPDKPEYKVEYDGVEMRMIDYFKQRLADGKMLI